jgi:hypothetical protein
LNYEWDNFYQLDAPALATLDQLYEVVNTIGDVQLNQAQIETSIKDLSASHLESKALSSNHMYVSTTYTALQDAKLNIRTAIHVIDNFMSKLANILMAAQSRKTSMYALNKLELLHLAKLVKQENKNLFLSTKISDVTTTIAHDGFRNLVLIFNVPVITKQSTFNIYKVFPIPKFSHNATYLPYYEHSNLAVSIDNEHYTVLSDTELHVCLNKPENCKTANLF